MSREIATRWAVLCPMHGRVYLTEQEYDAQISLANSRWTCPQECSPLDEIPAEAGACGEVSQWDDANYELWVEPG